MLQPFIRIFLSKIEAYQHKRFICADKNLAEDFQKF
jgi:hypothetical protein